MKRFLVVHPQFDGIGGAELVSIRIIEWIARTFDEEITLLTLTPVKVERLIRSGMSESALRKIRFISVNPPLFLKNPIDKLQLLKISLVHRRARAIAGGHKVCISTYNELDFGKRGIQYLHHPSFIDPGILRELNMMGRQSPLANLPLARYFYRKLISKVSRDSIDGYKRNITFVNSEFIRDVVERVYGINAEVIYPAFLSGDWFSNEVNWEQRDFKFVSVARIAPDKDILSLIDIYAALQNEFPAAKYVVAGWCSDRTYENLLLKTARMKGVPLEILKNLSDNDLRALLRTAKFYVHSKIKEHFGISIIEAAACGCLTLVHRSGSAEEIVKAPELLFENNRDLAAKVKLLLDNNDTRSKAIISLRSRLDEFTIDGFNSKLNTHLLPSIIELDQ